METTTKSLRAMQTSNQTQVRVGKRVWVQADDQTAKHKEEGAGRPGRFTCCEWICQLQQFSQSNRNEKPCWK